MEDMISFKLPFCLYRIDERVFKIGDQFNTTIKFEKEKIEPSPRTSHSHNIEFLRDRWGMDAKSKIVINSDKNFLDSDGNKNNDAAMSFSLGIVNYFIKLYRYFNTDEIHLVPVIREDLMEFKLWIDGSGDFTIGLGGGIAFSPPGRNTAISDSIENAVSNKFEVPLYQDLLLNAEHYIYSGEYRMSILESVIALELTLSNFIRQHCKIKGIADKDADKYITDVGITGNIKVTIKLLASSTNLPEENIFENCRGGITIRNDIVHRGRSLVTQTEANKTVKAIKTMIDFILPN